MITQKENSHTEQTKIKSKVKHSPFPCFISEYKLDFPERKCLYDLMLSLKDKFGNNPINQSPGKEYTEGDTYTIGGFQMNLHKNLGVNNFTELKVEHGISKEQEKALNKLSATMRIIANDYADDYPNTWFLNSAKMLYKNWFVMYNKGAFQEIHTHGTGNAFTMVYFCKVPDKLEYIGSAPERIEGSLVITNTNEDFVGTRVQYIKPEEDKLVIFPGYLPHYTLPLVSEGDRCVIVNDFYFTHE